MRYLLVFVILLTLSCEKKNIFDDVASTDSDNALYLDAKNHLDKFRYDEAINIIENRLSPSFRAQKKVQSTLMYSYGGKCGINFLTVVNRMTNTNATKFFEIAMDLFDNTTVDSVNCEVASEILATLGASAARTTSENLFGAILGLAQIGTTLKESIDANDDGTPDGTDLCNPAGQLTDAKTNRIAAGMGLVFENIGAVASEIDNSGMLDGLEDAKSLCETPVFPGVPVTPQGYGVPNPLMVGGFPVDTSTWTNLKNNAYLNISNPPTLTELGLPADVAEPLNCLNTSASLVTPKMRRILRRLVDSSTIGVGSCDISNISGNYQYTPPSPLPPATPTTPASININLAMNCCPALAVP